MPPKPKTRVMTDLLEEHLEELAILGMQRQRALRSPDVTPGQLAELDDRMEAHIQGLLVGGDAGLPLIEDALSQDDPNDVFAAAYTLLRLNSDAGTKTLIESLQQAQGKQLDGIARALNCGPIETVKDALRDSLASAPSPLAVVAAEALARFRKLGESTSRLVEFLRDDNPQVRRRAWRVVALIGN